MQFQTLYSVRANNNSFKNSLIQIRITTKVCFFLGLFDNRVWTLNKKQCIW